MRICRRLGWSILAGALLLGPSTGSRAASTSAGPTRATMVRITITITTTKKIVRGKVSTEYFFNNQHLHNSCVKPRCRFLVPRGVTLFFRQTPTDSYRWHFWRWKFTRLGVDPQTYLALQPSMGLVVAGNYRVRVLYVRVR